MFWADPIKSHGSSKVGEGDGRIEGDTALRNGQREATSLTSKMGEGAGAQKCARPRGAGKGKETGSP